MAYLVNADPSVLQDLLEYCFFVLSHRLLYPLQSDLVIQHKIDFFITSVSGRVERNLGYGGRRYAGMIDLRDIL